LGELQKRLSGVVSDDGGVGRWSEWSQEAESWRMETVPISSIITTSFVHILCLVQPNKYSI